MEEHLFCDLPPVNNPRNYAQGPLFADNINEYTLYLLIIY